LVDTSQPAKLSSDKISFNSRAVLLGLLTLVGVILFIYTIVVNVYDPAGVGRLTTVFIAAISGSLALGGTLIAQLWGKSGASNLPFVYSKTPIDTAVDVPINTRVSAIFNKTMNESTINKLTFKLQEETSKLMVDSTVKLEGANAVLVPSAPLNHATKYIVTIAKDVRDIEGNSMPSDITWSFSTE
jgi:Bacterial Ig-like domain